MIKRISAIFILISTFFFSSSELMAQKKAELRFSDQEFSKERCVGESCALVFLTWPEAVEKNEIAVKINQIVESELLAMIGGDSLSQSLDDAAGLFFASFEEVIQEYPDSPGGWSIEIAAQITNETDQMITFLLNGYSYGGGAHPNSSQYFLNFDKLIGELLTHDQLIIDSDRLLVEVEAAFRAFHQIPVGDDLEDHGFFIPEFGFFLPSTFGFQDGDFVLIYNPYEIGPYVLGSTELRFTREELGGIVRF
jgi:hypothetical protein